MNQALHDTFLPVALFLCVTYGFVFLVKSLVDARMRFLLARSGSSVDLIRAIVRGEELQRRRNSLRWGLILAALGLGFGLIQAVGWNEVTPGAVALLVGFTGLGNLLYFGLSTKFDRAEDTPIAPSP
jgi:hypothetical protein